MSLERKPPRLIPGSEQRTTAVSQYSNTIGSLHPPKIKVIHIYKDFDIYNGLIEEFGLLAKVLDKNRFIFKVCVFNYRGSTFGEHFQKCAGTLDSLNSRWEDNPLIIYKLYKYLKREKPDIVQTYVLKPNLYGRIAALLARVPVIISTELTLKNQAHTPLTRLRDVFLQPVNAFLNRYTDMVLCASDAIRKQWQTKRPSCRFQVLTPYFDPHKLQDSGAQQKRPWDDHKQNWVIGTVGRLSEEKRHVDLLKAFRGVLDVFPMAGLVIVGDGDQKNRLRKFAAQSNLAGKVVFAGFQRNVSEYLAQMDLFVLPSRTEGFPLVLLEAMSVGLPVIATRVGGIPELVVDTETGLLVRPLRPKELSNAMLNLLSDPAKMRSMGEKGRARVFSSFSAERFIREHESVYESALAAKGIVQDRRRPRTGQGITAGMTSGDSDHRSQFLNH